MRRVLWVLPVIVLTIAASSVAQQPAARPATRRAAAAPQNPFKPIATVKDIMDAMIIPASDVIFGAVGSTTNAAGGVEDKAPKTAEEWLAVRHNGLLLAEGGNLLMMSGRHAATTKSAHPGTELEPEQIDALVAKDRAGWIKQAQALIDASMIVLKAVDAKNADDLLNAGGDLDTACENCHMKYWYPKNP